MVRHAVFPTCHKPKPAPSSRIKEMWAVEALKEWHDFYVLVGTAGATLLALLFVAVSLGAGYLTEERQSATRTFMSPVVVHLTSEVQSSRPTSHRRPSFPSPLTCE